MKNFVAPILGSALMALIAGTALASSALPVDSRETKPAAAEASSAATAAPAAATAPAATAAATTAVEPGKKEQSVKIGYLDMANIASETDSGKAVSAVLKVKSLKLRTRIEAKQKQIEKQKAAIEAKIASLSPKERASKAKEFQKKMEEYQKLVRSSDQQMQDLQEKLTSELYMTIKKAAAAYGKSHGYAAVLAKKDILYLSDTLEQKDLTEDISVILDKKPSI